jgi:hypothetical protein
MADEGRRTVGEEVESCVIDAPSNGIGLNQEKSWRKNPTEGKVS